MAQIIMSKVNEVAPLLSFITPSANCLDCPACKFIDPLSMLSLHCIVHRMSRRPKQSDKGE